MQIKKLCAAALFACAASAYAQPPRCEGGAYLNPRAVRGETSFMAVEAEAALVAVMARTGLPTKPLVAIKRKAELSDMTKAGRPPCWVLGNPVVGLGSGYKAAVVNVEPIRPMVLLLAEAKAQDAPGPVALESMAPTEQVKILDRLKKSRCFGIDSGVATAIVRAEGLCAKVEDVAAKSGIGPQVLPVKAAFEWSEQSWTAFVTPDESFSRISLKGLPGRSEKVANARIIVIGAKSESFGYGLYVHPSVGDIERLKAASIFLDIAGPSKPLAAALDLDQKFSFAVPTAAQVARMESVLGL